MLQVQHLHKTYRVKGKATHAVQDVSLQIGAGQVLAFLGPNGAGKTTTIKMIAGSGAARSRVSEHRWT